MEGRMKIENGMNDIKEQSREEKDGQRRVLKKSYEKRRNSEREGEINKGKEEMKDGRKKNVEGKDKVEGERKNQREEGREKDREGRGKENFSMNSNCS